jgi:hypothetical protein
MTYDMINLAKRAVACKGWRFIGGMRVLDPIGPQPQRISDDDEGEASWRDDYWLPDLTDPATLGCLLALVREARSEPTYLPTCLDAHDEAWVINPPIPWRQTRYESYASVLVAALEAAP